MTFELDKKIEGLLYFISALVLCAVLLWPPLSDLLRHQSNLAETQTRLGRLQASTAKPVEPSDTLRYRSLVAGVDRSVLPEALRAQLSSLVQENALQQVTIEPVQTIQVGEHLSRYSTRLKVEGDLAALLAFIQSLGELERPVLIRELSVEAQQTIPRSDQNLVSILVLDMWQETAP
jgi:hypothetical protein